MKGKEEASDESDFREKERIEDNPEDVLNEVDRLSELSQHKDEPIDEKHEKWQELEKTCHINENPYLVHLNRLAWLLNTSTKSCTAVFLARNKLVISENDIFDRTMHNSRKFTHIYDILIGLANIVRGLNSTGQWNKKALTELFELIFDQKFDGEEAGYLKAAVRYKEGLINLFGKFLENLREFSTVRDVANSLISSTNSIGKSASRSRQKLMAAVGLRVSKVLCLIRIISFLASEDGAILRTVLNSLEPPSEAEDQSSSSARRFRIIRYSKASSNLKQGPNPDDREWLRSDDYGFAILATNKKGAHAELKSVDCLLSSIIDNKTITDIVPIGISRKCCKDCYITILAVVLVLENHNIRASGSHYLSFDKWVECKPFFFKTRSQGTTKENSDEQVKRNKELIGNIQKKIREIEAQIKSRSLVLPNPEDHMSHSDSSQPSPKGTQLNPDDSGHSPNKRTDSSSTSSSSSTFFKPGTADRGIEQSAETAGNEDPLQATKNALTNLLRHLRAQRYMSPQTDIAIDQENLEDILSLMDDVKEEIENSKKDAPSNIG